MESRKCENFLDSYMEYTDPLESPDNYHIWCALSAIAACVRRRAYVDMGFFRIYPNMYIVLVGPAGKCRKNTAINASIDLVKEIPDIILSSDAITRESLIKSIKESKKIDEIGGKPYIHCSYTIVSKELSVFLGTGNHDLLSVLTDLYDSHKKWEYKTKTSGIDTLHNMWLNLLGGTTPNWLVGSVPLTAIGGGFTSRVMFIVEDSVRKKNLFPELTKKELLIKDNLIYDLETISRVHGKYELTGKAKVYLDDWYQTDNTKIDDSRFWGYSERKHIHILKVALILAIADGAENEIKVGHIKMALTLINSIEGRMMGAFGSAGRSMIATDIDELYNLIKKAEKISRKDLMNSTWTNIGPEALDTSLSMLESMGKIKREQMGSTFYYTFIHTE